MAETFNLPPLGENIEKGTVVNVLVKSGDSVRKDQPVIEVETEKAVVDVPSPAGGVVVEVKVKAGDAVKPGQPILVLDGAASPGTPAPAGIAPKPEPARSAPNAEPPEPPAEAPPVPAAAPEPPPPSPKPSGPVTASPSVRKFARELGVDISQVPRGGRGGRVSTEDVKIFVKRRMAAPAAALPVRPAAELPDFSKWGAVERAKMSGIRRATSRHMAAAWAQAPPVTPCAQTDVSDLEEMRKDYAKTNPSLKLTVTAVALKIVAAALRKFPSFNASVDEARGEIILKKYIHIGVAVDTEHGLLVPVIRDVDKKSLTDLAQELGRAAERARKRKLSLEDLQGGCFTITNLGGIGGTQFSPIVNWPEVAILGISRSSRRPVYADGSFAPALMMPLSLTYDHRAIDGAGAARFLRWIAQAFQHPLMLEL